MTRYICYYSGSHSSGWHSIGAAYSDSPWGPYTDLGRPLVQHSWVSIKLFTSDVITSNSPTRTATSA